MENPLGRVVDLFKKGYFFLEDKYYHVLDKINQHVPIYKIVDPLDTTVPSFALLIAVVFLLIVFFIFLATSSVALTATINVVDNQNQVLDGTLVSLVIGGQTTELITDDWGEASLDITASEIEAEASFSKDGFQNINRTITLIADEIVSVTMQPNIPAITLQDADRTIKVVDGKTNRAITGVSLSFVCTNGGFAPSTQSSNTGEFTVVQPSNCPALTATATATGYNNASKNISSGTTYIRMTAKTITGSITVIVKDTTGTKEPDVIVRALDEPGNTEKASSSTTLSGTALLQTLSPGNYTVSVSSPDGRTGQKTGVLVRVGETTTVTITLPNANQADIKKIYLKLIEQGTTNPVSNVQAFIYENNILVDSTTSNSLGIVEKNLSNINSTYLVVLRHPDFVTKIESDVLLKELSDTIPINVPMIRSTMEEPNPTSAEIVLTVVDEALDPVQAAEVTIYNSTYPEIPLNTPPGQTSEEGIYTFTNLASGTYFARATDEDDAVSGKSDEITVAAGESAVLELILVQGEGSVEVFVFDQDSASETPISGATVDFVDANDSLIIITSCQTDVDGKCESNSIPADREVLVKASAANFVSEWSVLTIDIVDGVTEDVSIGLMPIINIPPEIEIGKIDTSFEGLYEDQDCEDRADWVQSDELGTLTYYARFELLFTEDTSYTDIVQHVRAGLDSELNLPLPTGYKIKIMGVTGPLFTAAPMSRCWNNSPVDPFNDPLECPDGVEPSVDDSAKQANLYYPDMGGLQIVPFVIQFDVEPGLEHGERLELHYIAKAVSGGEALVTANKVKILLVDAALCEGENFAWAFNITDSDGATTVIDTEPGATNLLEMNGAYTLSYKVYNCSNTDFFNTILSAENTAPVPTTISFTPSAPFDFGPKTVKETFSFQKDTEVSGTVPIYSVLETVSTGLEFTLATEYVPSYKEIGFAVESNQELKVTTAPEKLNPNIGSQTLFGKVMDSVLQETAPIEGATVSLEVGTGTMTAITGSEGEFVINGIEQLSGISSVTLTVRKAGYKTFEKEIEVGLSPPIPNPSLDCISIEKNDSNDVNIHLQKPGAGIALQTDTFTIINDCEAAVVIQLNSELRAEAGGSSEPFDLNPSSLEIITVYAETVENSPYPIYMGEYGIGVLARFMSDDSAAGFAGPLAVARVYVTDPNSMFRLADPDNPENSSAMKSSYDLKGEPSEGLIKNKDYTYFEDLRLPMLDKVHDYGAVEELFSLIYTPLTQPGVEKQRQKVDFYSDEDLFTNQAEFDDGGNLFIDIVDSGGYVFINWIDLLMTDGEHNGGDRHRVWAQTSRDSWTNVTSELPYTAAIEPKEKEIEKIIASSEAAFAAALNSNDAKGTDWEKVYVEGSTIADLRLPFPVIDNSGWVDTETYYPQGTKFLEDLTIGPIWQGQHNVCNSNLDGFDSTLAVCSVQDYRSGSASMPYAIGHIANTIALESKGDSEFGTKIFAAKWSYMSTDKDHFGWIDFKIRNNLLMGEEYALIEVEDSTGVNYVIDEDADAGGDITLTYQVFKRGTLETIRQITPVDQGSSAPLLLPDGDILAISTDGSPKVFSGGTSFDSIYTSIRPVSPKQVTAITFTSNEDTEKFEIDWGDDLPGPPYIKYYIYSGGGWSTPSIFDIGPDEVGNDDKFWAWSGGTALLPQAEVIIFENGSNTTVKIDKITLSYLMREEKESVPVTTVATIPLGESSISIDLPATRPSLNQSLGTYVDERYVIIEDSPFAMVTFSDTGTIISEDPYSSANTKIIVSVSTPEQESQIGTERFHIRIIGQSQDQCIGKDGVRGSTGPGAEPRILLDWDWDSIGIDRCDPNNPDFIYCDPTQFTISLIKRLEKMRALAEEDLVGNLLELRQMQEFNAYLIEDTYTDDFRHDFVEYYNTQFLSSAILNHVEHPWGNYLLDNEGRFEFDTLGASSDGTTGLVDAGMHEIFIGLNFDNDQFEFFNADTGNDLLADIKIEFINVSDPIIQNPFYYLPFNGEVGIYEGGSRDDYGLEFNNENNPLAIVKSPLGTSFETDSSSGLKLVETEVISDFGTINNTDTGLLLNILQDQARIIFAPSTATPILLQMEPDAEKVEAYYWLRDVPGNVAMSSANFMNLWAGTGSTMKLDGACVDYYGSSIENRILDSAATDGTCAANVDGSYGFLYDSAQEEQLYFETVFYVPESYELNLRKSCQNNSYFYSPNGRTETTNTPLSLTYFDSRTRAVTIENVLNLITDEYVCVSSDDKGFYFWWNPQKVISELDTVKENIPNWDEISCDISG